ncbi:MAG: ribosome maturation factor RimP [Candidatus Zixiibacteriota bacterium]
MAEERKRIIAGALAPALQKAGFELVEIKLAQYGRSSRLRLFIDTQTDAGVSVEDCAQASRLVGEILEAERFFESDYHLEVSSPGIDRPLTTERDFRRRVGRTIWIDFIDSDRTRLEGELECVEGDQLALAGKKQTHRVRLSEIREARERT